MPDNAGGVPYLRIERVTKSFGGFQALKGVSLDIHAGELVCFLGPSGCGKTTLLRAIAGLDVQSAGAIHQAGRDISSLPPAERDFGIVFQSYALFPNLSVAANVGYGLVSRRGARAEIARRVAELLQMVGLPDQGGKYPPQLSGGQQQRVALARALALSPGLLLLDEPLSALDARVRVHLRHEIHALQRRLKVTTILVTHDQEEALTMADRVVVMNQGVIEQVGTPEEIYRRPVSAFVADFVGRMNFLPAEAMGVGRVRFAGMELVCAESFDGLAPGTAISLCLRPEDVVVRGAAERGNVFEARIAELEFFGTHFRAELRPLAAPETMVAADFSINAMQDLDLKAGDKVSVALPAERLRIFPRDGGGAA
jgi:iron(III) transport system ATP-binding protein